MTVMGENLTLDIFYAVWHSETERPAVVVSVGGVEIAALSPCRESRASHGDDSTYFASERRAIAAETVAPYLRRLFDGT